VQRARKFNYVEAHTITDRSGHYQVSVSLEATASGGQDPVTKQCVFTAPDSINPTARANASLTFYPSGTPTPMQLVDLRAIQRS
jgi:hypothetical protein